MCIPVHVNAKRGVKCPPYINFCSFEARSLPEPGTQIFSVKLEASTARQASYIYTTCYLLYGCWYLTPVLRIARQAFLTAEQS